MAAREGQAPLTCAPLIDTSVASLLLAGGELPPPYAEWTADNVLAISFQTVEEMLYGAYRASWGERRIGSLEAFLRRWSVVAGTWEVAAVSARVRAEAEAQGRRLEGDDAWIVATAVHLGVPLITDDRDQIIPGLTGYTYVSRHA
jgi:tRNA(fMet)-specific endonuclease VapC